VPLELNGLRIARQEMQADGKLHAEVIATKKEGSAPIVECGALKSTVCARVANATCRWMDRVEVVLLYKRRFWCVGCQKAFTESDSARGRYRRTTLRLHEEIGKVTSTQPCSLWLNTIKSGRGWCKLVW
jgi:transposase